MFECIKCGLLFEPKGFESTGTFYTLCKECGERVLNEGRKRKMQISKEEMEAILVMYRIVCAEGQESDIMVGLAKRIEKEKRRWKKKRGE